jgi:hypothetical protein
VKRKRGGREVASAPASSVRGVSLNHMAKHTAKSRQDGGRLNTRGEYTRGRSIHNGARAGRGGTVWLKYFRTILG